ncbi:DNA/RNA helicase, superfamily II, SNF2 family (plasmid) [Nostoc sp. PCC 7524]|uniref:DEAD/DEAH box helicase n=1 Tax=Nostoc sp. (strain ATCC 29411 / PCC 7524) TaxID=28072 RepID=UPI00029EDCED|nr:DEAD/DEAH box helicase [Nostoc sp. PCC 7524]AFY51344.1 DNA/RNA helicase, superfamily II, SNF2 family [Nostoc sp. PCC 7524]
MPNYHPKTEHLTKQKAAWQHLPTKAVRVPEIFLEEIERYARSLDNGLSPQIISASSLELIRDSIKNLELEDLIKLQLELPLIIEEKKEQRCDRSLEDCIIYLADRCDYAYSQDGAGFNGADAGFGHWLASRIRDKKPIIKAHAKAALKILHKYEKQLNRGNLQLPQWDLIEHQYPEDSPKVGAINDNGQQYIPEKRVEVKGDLIAVYAPYDSSGKFQRDCKTIEGYRFEGSDKSWRFPINKSLEVKEKLITDEFHISAQFKGAIALAQMQLEEEKAAKEAEALAMADEIVKFVEAADLNAPLANGWYLRDYQKKGVEWLLAHRRGGIYTGGILSDHMGLGKSLTALVAARAMQRTHDCPVFVIAPVSVMDNWVREASRAEVKIECFSWAKLPKPLETKKYVLICDEAHYAQNIASARTKKMLELAHHENCLTAWLLTGTPIKNGRPVNLYPLLCAVNHPLANDKYDYERRYCNAYHKDIGRKTVWDNTGASHLDELSQKTEDVILRRTKQQCLKELPDKTRLFEKVELETKQLDEYQDTVRLLVDDYRRRSQCKKFKYNLPILFKCSSFKLWLSWVLAYNPADPEAEALATLNILRKVGSEFKVEAAIATAGELLEQGEQVVIFTEFVESAKAIATELDGLLLTGETKPIERQLLIDQFQLGDKKVFVGTIKAGGVGITLTAASNVILVDRAWTPGDCEQAEDRCHRLGQQNAVFATWLQLGHVDQAIDDLLIQKQQRIELVLKGKRKTLKGINSPKDLAKELLAIL